MYVDLVSAHRNLRGRLLMSPARSTIESRESLAGAIMYDFSLTRRGGSRSRSRFIILDMEHQALDFERMQAFFRSHKTRPKSHARDTSSSGAPLVRIPTYGRDQNEFITKQCSIWARWASCFQQSDPRAGAPCRPARALSQTRGSPHLEPRGLRATGNFPGVVLGSVSRRLRAAGRPWPLNPQGDLLLFLQVETVEGVRSQRDLVRPRIAVLFVGPNDLSYSPSAAGPCDHEAAVQTVLKACIAGMPLRDYGEARQVVTRLSGVPRRIAPERRHRWAMEEALRRARTVIK